MQAVAGVKARRCEFERDASSDVPASNNCTSHRKRLRPDSVGIESAVATAHERPGREVKPVATSRGSKKSFPPNARASIREYGPAVHGERAWYLPAARE